VQFLKNPQKQGEIVTPSGQAKRDPESHPAWRGIQAGWDSGAYPGPDPAFAGMTDYPAFAGTAKE
jgi:hypothetical protein